MSKILFLLLISQALFPFNWDSLHTYTLKKDQVAKVEITNREDQTKELIKFRWTLYTNKRLVLLLKKGAYPTQYILQQRYKANSIKINLSDEYIDEFDRAFLRLSFKDFKSKKAKFDLFVSDPKKRFYVEFIDPKN
ncbi:MAG: hypothetical protein DSZ06_02945 [Sulfurospirillum sp.]|nr:MAG: hypothetical protein DSZ06_02945 [Sulfurospirillum sp.]